MNKPELNLLITEYLESETTDVRKEEIKKLLLEQEFDLKELEQLEKVTEEFELLNIPEPSENMDKNFYSMLDMATHVKGEPEKTTPLQDIWEFIKTKNIFPKIAYSFALLIIGWFFGNQISPNTNYNNQISNLNTEVLEMKKVMMISMLNQSSPSERIKAVNSVNDFNKIDDKIISALLTTLNTDNNVNVRIITIEALSDFADNPNVRAGLVKSIVDQESPIVQLALADLMVKLNEKTSIENFKTLLAKKDLNYAVRDKLEQTIHIL